MCLGDINPRCCTYLAKVLKYIRNIHRSRPKLLEMGMEMEMEMRLLAPISLRHLIDKVEG